MLRTSIIGLGRIGLPTALLIDSKSLNVIGVDTCAQRRRAISEKSVDLEEPGLEHLLHQSKLQVRSTPSCSDIFLICVPTPLTERKEADLSHLHAAIDSISPHLRDGNLVIIESTCPIGTTESLAEQFPGVHFTYCPERVMPGNLLSELVTGSRIIGGIDQQATQMAHDFYAKFCKGKLYKTTARMAEAVKLAENAYRDVNIAYANALSMIASQSNLCPKELISLANAHPRVNIMQPGIGVGGHCIPVDPYFLISAFPEESDLLRSARHINERKRVWVEDKIRNEISKVKAKKIVLLGLTYKANVSDFRLSPAMKIYHNLKSLCEVILVDPFLPESPPLEKAIYETQLLVTLVNHDAFKTIDHTLLDKTCVLDFAGVFK